MSEENNMTNNTPNNNVLMGIIIALLIVIAVLAFFVGKNSAPTQVGTTPTGTSSIEGLEATIYVDSRCTNCKETELLTSLKQVPGLGTVEFKTKDFADEGVKEYLETNKITYLPAVIFNMNTIDASINQYLQPLDSKEYSLQVNATYNPFLERSERGFLMLEQEKLSAIKADSYIEGNVDAAITWLEYSDLECPYCAKLHNSGTPEALKEKYGTDLNVIFNHFPLGFHPNAQPGAEILECLGEAIGSDAFYALLTGAYKAEKSTKSYLLDEAEKLGANRDAIEACLDAGTYTDKVTAQMTQGGELFGITGTPGNVLINNKTGEYEVLSGAYPTKDFEDIIDRLIK